jgi:formamidase
VSLRIETDRAVRLDRGGRNGHNRWTPELEPVASCDPGALVTFELRDARDGEIRPASDHEDLLSVSALAHPLTGPLEVRGAEPGDVLEVEIVDYETDDFGWTAIWPGMGFLGDLFERPFLARWQLDDHRARSDELPGVAVPAGVFAGVIGVAPSPELVERARERERALGEEGGLVNPPSAECAAPPSAADALRTYPPRENGGNMDVRDLVAGARLWLPVHAPGALLSIGDLHFAQGDGEVCISAIETGGTATVRVNLRRDGWRPSFPCWESPPRAGRTYFATTGIPLDDAGRNADRELGLAARRALLELLDWLRSERGLGREAAYVLMSVAAELRVSETVNAPNALVSAALPLDVFATG